MITSNKSTNKATLAGATVDSPPSAIGTIGGRENGRRKKVAAAAGKTANWLFVITAVLLILIAILLVLARVGLPWLANYKGEFEKSLSEQVGSPAVIDELSIRWEHFAPKISATGVSLNESANRKVALDEVLIELSLLKSISQATPVIEELTLVGAKLALEATADGHYQLHGLKQSQSAEASPTQGTDMLKWLMGTARVDVQDAQITLIDSSNNEQFTISDLNITTVNDDNLHQLRVDMQLPEALGEHIELGLDLVGSSDDIRNANAELHVKASDLKIDAWRALQAQRFGDIQLSSTGIARLDATTQVELWGTLSAGSLQSARGQIVATDLIDVNSQKPVIDRISADIAFTKLASGWQLETDSLEFEKGSQLTSVNELVYQYKPAAETAWKLDASGDSLKLDVATQLVLSLFDTDAKMPRSLWLAQADPKGDLGDWRASFALVNKKPDFSLYSVFKDLELDAASGVPGAKNIAGTLDIQHNVGKISLQGENTELDLPAAYTQPLSLEQFGAELNIDFQDPLSTTLKGDIDIDDLGFRANTRVEVKLESGASPHIFTQGNFSIDDVSRAPGYLPRKLFAPVTNNWIDQALVAGKATNGELLMFGKIADFPFTENEGVLKAGFDFKDASLDYLKGWPLAEKMQGRFDVEGASIKVTASDGVLDAMRFTKVDARIDNLFNPVLELNSTSAGALAKMVDFGNTGPLKTILGPALSDVTANGQAQMDLSISVPLKRQASSSTDALAATATSNSSSIPGLKVNGSIFLTNNSISMAGAKLDLENVRGAVGFTGNGIRVNNLQALMYGRPVRIDGKTEGLEQARTAEITMAGPMRVTDILDNYDIPLTAFVEGESQWNVSVRIPMTATVLARNGIKLSASSNLIGTSMLLPAPLGKPVSTSASIALSSTIMPESEKGEWLIDYNDVMRSITRVDGDELTSFSARFGGGAPKLNVTDGIRLDGTVTQLGLDGWASSVATLIEELEELEPAAAPTLILPISGELRVDRFIAGRQFVGGGRLRFNTDAKYINGVINSQWLTGSVRYPREHWTKEIPAVVRVSSVDKRFLDALETAPEVEDSTELDPRELPPIEARISQLQWDQLNLKDLTIRTSPVVNGLSVDTFGFAYDSAQLVGDGYWHLRDPQGVNETLTDQHVSKLNLTLQGYDFGELLTHVGFGGTLNEGEGVLSASLVWPDAGYKPSLENMVGDMSIDMKNGRILNVEPGAARLVGLFALQSLPRRFSLDFKDLVLDGLDYETIRGQVQIANGIAHAPLVQMNGSIGVVDIAGESNLINEQYNQRITVLPRVSAALPVIGIISGGATAGLGVLFAGGLLKAVGIDFDRIGLREYSLTGSWDSPEFTAIPFELPEQ